MGLIIKTTDFTGKYKVSQSVFSDLQLYIDKYEELYLIQLLGVELFDLFKADVVSFIPQSAPFTTIYNPIRVDFNSTIVISEGMKEMIKGFIYFEFVRDQKDKNTINGPVRNVGDVSNETPFDALDIFKRYNEAVTSYCAIQWYISENNTDFPSYNGQKLQLTFGY